MFLNVQRKKCGVRKRERDSSVAFIDRETERFVRNYTEKSSAFSERLNDKFVTQQRSSTRYTVKCIKIKYNNISSIRYQFHFIDSKSIHIPLFRSSIFSRNRYWYSTYSNVHSRIYISVKWNRNFSFQFRIL